MAVPPVQTFFIWPAERLKDKRRYIVALRDLRSATRTNDEGDPLLIAPPEGFRILRDDEPTMKPDLRQRKHHFAERKIFETLLNSTWIRSKGEVQLAWDFSTASLESTTEHLRFMRDDAFRRVRKESNYRYTVKRVYDEHSNHIYRKVIGTFRSPLYLYTDRPTPRSTLARNYSGSTFIQQLRPVFQKWVDVPFSIWIPRRAVEPVPVKVKGGNGTLEWDASGVGQATLVQHGHGLFQDRDEGGVPFLQEWANADNFVVLASDWWGLQVNSSSSSPPPLYLSHTHTTFTFTHFYFLLIMIETRSTHHRQHHRHRPE